MSCSALPVTVRAISLAKHFATLKEFYEHYGFQLSPLHPMTLMLRLNTG